MFGSKKKQKGGTFKFRVSDVVDVPLRGTLLRLRLQEGTPSMSDLGTGARLRLTSPGGTEREVSISAHSVTGGAATQERLDRTRELDVMIREHMEGSGSAGEPVEIGWTATGPVG